MNTSRISIGGIIALSSLSLMAGCVAGDDADYEFIANNDGATEEAAQALSYFRGHSYVFSTLPASWVDAESECEAFDRHLVTIDDYDEENWLQGEEDRAGGGLFWIGLNDREDEGQFRWITGPLEHTNWYPGEPNNWRGREDCVVDNYRRGTWNDGTCADRNRFICESW